jgi:hypothetical protein
MGGNGSPAQVIGLAVLAYAFLFGAAFILARQVGLL